MHKKPLTLSIVIPVYNEELYLSSCLEAISRQTVMPVEVIVVDNNSTDKTVNIARKYSFVTVIFEPKLGVIFARDTGFNSVKADIIARIDADTLISKNWVERLLKIFSNPSVDATTGPVGLYDLPLASLNHAVDNFMRRYVYFFGNKQMKPFLSGPNMALRSCLWQKIKSNVCRDKLIHEDIDLAIHVAKVRGKIVYDSELRASVSSRRYNDKFSDFRIYMQMFDYTYRRHNLHGFRVKSASTMYWLGYFAVHPLRPLLKIINKLFRPNIPFDTTSRKNPN